MKNEATYKRRDEARKLFKYIPEFIASATSRVYFCKKYGIDPELFDQALEEISSMNPELKEQIKEAAVNASARY